MKTKFIPITHHITIKQEHRTATGRLRKNFWRDVMDMALTRKVRVRDPRSSTEDLRNRAAVSACYYQPKKLSVHVVGDHAVEISPRGSL